MIRRGILLTNLVFDSNYFQNGTHKTTCLENFFGILKIIKAHDHNFVSALKLPTTVMKKEIP